MARRGPAAVFTPVACQHEGVHTKVHRGSRTTSTSLGWRGEAVRRHLVVGTSSQFKL